MMTSFGLSVGLSARRVQAGIFDLVTTPEPHVLLLPLIRKILRNVKIAQGHG